MEDSYFQEFNLPLDHWLKKKEEIEEQRSDLIMISYCFAVICHHTQRLSYEFFY